MIERLTPHESAVAPPSMAGPDHPMRKVTRRVAFDGGWDAERARKVGALFDGMAADWASDSVEPSTASVIGDGLERGRLDRSGRWIELGSGTGAGTRVLAPHVAQLTAFDLAAAMLAEAPAHLAPRVHGDANVLPFADATFDVVVMVNMLLFPHEVDRVLRPSGSVLWVNTLGDQTPIHLPPDDVCRALPGEWCGVTAEAGTGFWAVLTRS
ncbi:MAG: class I SAM-dependent methyltransferase [Acidimicrobiales bacterium]